ncbi:MAG TPA: hypothetical protein DD381_02440 [Lentisphaeria bacterium]|nr:MAG: hypothetical protein A2X47_08595 [Lentisphaerae bacterium GWF2_38_69]HBM15193.1 hypothetical protein [Lentisphaeria bacterium]
MQFVKNKFFKSDTFSILLLTIAIAFVYSFSANFPFINWDDYAYVAHNGFLPFSFDNIRTLFSRSFVGLYIPLTMLSYMLDYAIWGLNPLGYHLQNIFWHIVAVVFVYKIFRYFDIRSSIALLICLFFALSPQRVESVVWISERKDVLCAALYFMSIYFYLKYPTKKGFAVSFVLFVFAVFSKPMAVSLPFVLYIYEKYKDKDIRHIFYPLKLYPFFILSLILMPLAMKIKGGTSLEFNFVSCISTSLHNLFWYVYKTFSPLNSLPVYPKIPDASTTIVTILLSGIFALAILVCLFLRKRSAFFITLAIISCYIISILPVSGLVTIGYIDHADRYSYIPSVFLLLGLSLLLNKFFNAKKGTLVNYPHLRIASTKKIILLFMIIYLFVIAYLNVVYQAIWKTGDMVFLYSVNSYYANPLILAFLAESEIKYNNLDKAVYYSTWLTFLERDRVSDSKLEELLKNINIFLQAEILFKEKKYNLSLYYLFQVRKYFNKNNEYSQRYLPSITYDIANCYYYLGDKKMAVKVIDEFLNGGNVSDSTILLRFLACRFYFLQDFSSAIQIVNEYIKRSPNDKQAVELLKYLEENQVKEYDKKIDKIFDSPRTFKAYMGKYKNTDLSS